MFGDLVEWSDQESIINNLLAYSFGINEDFNFNKFSELELKTEIGAQALKELFTDKKTDIQKPNGEIDQFLLLFDENFQKEIISHCLLICARGTVSEAKTDGINRILLTKIINKFKDVKDIQLICTDVLNKLEHNFSSEDITSEFVISEKHIENFKTATSRFIALKTTVFNPSAEKILPDKRIRLD
ncbi:MAG: hypothetical protein ACI9TO_000274 [Rickettsiales bacterium]|jgi:hypothetical protein